MPSAKSVDEERSSGKLVDEKIGQVVNQWTKMPSAKSVDEERSSGKLVEEKD